MRLTNFEKVYNWNYTAGVEAPDNPGFQCEGIALDLIEEEFEEVKVEFEKGDIFSLAKELADLLYVTYGAAYRLGIPMDDVFAKVHDSNMTKFTTNPLEAALDITDEVDDLRVVEVGGVYVIKDSNGKVRKSSGYQPVDVYKLF